MLVPPASVEVPGLCAPDGPEGMSLTGGVSAAVDGAEPGMLLPPAVDVPELMAAACSEEDMVLM